jgi:DNA-3-methyladenine glycosylase
VRLSNDFFHQPTEIVARELLGKKLTHVIGGKTVSGLIVETEAYLGLSDKAAHSYGGKRTSRTNHLYQRGGSAYIYLIYGMYNCFNVVCGDENRPEAVLIRALEPVDGISFMQKQRGRARDKNLTNGPGKLCDALRITKNQNGHNLRTQPLFIEDVGSALRTNQIVAAKRVGIDYAEEAIHWPLRFYVKENTFVSKTTK